MPGRIFDREQEAHPWWRALDPVAVSPGPDRRFAVAANWRMDHRVSAERERLDLLASGHFEAECDVDSWFASLGRYVHEEICQPATSTSPQLSAYVRPTNDANRITARAAGFDEFVHVGCLDSILRRAMRGEAAADADAGLRRLLRRGLPARFAGTNHLRWYGPQVDELARFLISAGEEAVRRVAGLLLDSLGDREPPWWACIAEEIRGVLDSGNAAWIAAALGLGHLQEGCWLLLWRYRVDQVLPLYRPTVVEAAESPWHHPSPPGHGFGITMPLALGLPACREALHRPLRGATAITACTGELLQLVNFPPVDHNDLIALRARHRERLREELAIDDSSAWLDRHQD